MLICFVVSRWSPGAISTIGTIGLATMTGISWLQHPVVYVEESPWPVAVFIIALGVGLCLFLCRYFPPAWLTRVAGNRMWLLGNMVLLTAVSGYPDAPDGASRWVGRPSAIADLLDRRGTWLFAKGGDWTWAFALSLSAAMLVGLWSVVAVNAGIALLLAGFVLIAIGARSVHMAPEGGAARA